MPRPRCADRRRLAHSGVGAARAVNPGEYARMHGLEAAHWWFVAKRRLVLGLLDRHLERPAGRPPRVLDVGCGTGGMLLDLRAAGCEAAGLDACAQALRFCREKGLARLARASVASLPVAGGSQDAALLLDVLYHRGAGDEVRALAGIRAALKPGGLLIVSDSAFQSLYGRHDEAVHGRRRYRLGEMEDLVRAAGFRVLRAGYHNSFLFPLLAAARLASRILPGRRQASDLSLPPAPVNRVLLALRSAENALILRGLRFPCGLSLYVAARRD